MESTQVHILTPTSIVAELKRPEAVERPLPLSGEVLVVGFSDQDSAWAQNWLRRESLASRVFTDVDEAAKYCLDTPPSVLICPISALCSDHRSLPLFLKEELRNNDIACICVVQNDKEIARALDLNVADIARKPLNWSILCHRAKTLSEMSEIRTALHNAESRMRAAQKRALDASQHLSLLDDVDQLTGLPKMQKFRHLLEGALTQKTPIVLLNIGVERFHLINETHGREVGNQVLVAVAARLRNLLLRPELYASDVSTVVAASIAKLDGVRFAIFLPHNGLNDHLTSVRKLLSAELAKPVSVNSSTIYLSTSIGGAISPQHGENASELLTNAVRAMAEVKRKGGGFSFYKRDGKITSARHLQLDGWLRQAIDRQELRVAYQPLVNMWNNQIVGAEALLRWTREDGSVISPAEFIPVAEMNGSVVEIGDYVINAACAELRRWKEVCNIELRMAVNLSITQLRRGNVVRTLENAIRLNGIDPEQIEMEISERGDIGSDQRIIRQLHEIKAIGVRLSLDDFGTGDTAIEYLKKLPIDILKIDRSYVSGALENGADSVITNALVSLARKMNLTVIAEGIESKEQYELLRSWKCHLYQGYYCSPAVSSDEFLNLVLQHHPNRNPTNEV